MFFPLKLSLKPAVFFVHFLYPNLFLLIKSLYRVSWQTVTILKVEVHGGLLQEEKMVSGRGGQRPPNIDEIIEKNPKTN